MKTTIKWMTRRYGASIAIATALAAAQTALAATDIYWQGGNGSETNPVNIYSKSSWTGSNTYSGSGISKLPCNEHNLQFGFAADAEDTTAWLKCDGTTDSTAIANLFTTHSGHFIFTFGSFRTISNFSVGRLSGDNSTITKKDGDWTIGGDLNIGYVADSTGIVEVVGGSISVSKTQYIGYSGNGTLTINGGTVEVASGYNTNPGWNSGSSGTINLNRGFLKTKRIAHNNGSGRLNFNGGTLQANAASGDSPLIKNGITVTVGDGGGSIDNGGYDITIGAALGGADDTGRLHLTGDGTTSLGNTFVKNGKIVVDGGTVSASALHIGESSGNDGYVEVNGGTLSIPNNIFMGYANNSTATLTINGGMVEVDSSKQLFSANASGSHGTINLNGGVLRTKRIAHDRGSCTINFNGGTLQANAENADFIKSGTTVNVGAAGGTIDNGGYNLTIAASNIDGTGGLTFKGGGTNTFSSTTAIKSTYSGVTSVALGTTLVIYRNDAMRVLDKGLALVGVPELNKPYTLMTAANESDWSSFDISKVTCPVAENFTVELVKRTESDTYTNSIVVTVTSLKSGNVWTGAKDSNMSDPDNWLEGVLPGAGADIDLSAATTVNADLDRTFGTVKMGAGVVTFTGSLTATSFSDTSKVAVGANSTVTVYGNLEFSGSADEYICNTVAAGGRFAVTGDIVVKAAKGNSSYLTPSMSSCAGVIAAKGLVKEKEGGTNYGRMFKLAPDGGHVNWEIGEDGISGKDYFFVNNTAGSSAKIVATTNFTVSAAIANLKNLEFDAAGWTIVLGDGSSGGIQGNGSTTVSGTGRVVANYDVDNLTSTAANKTQPFTVSGTATLALIPGARICTGVVTVNSGATLEVAESGTVSLGGNLTLADGAALGFNYTNRDAPVLDLTGKTVTFDEGATTNVVVKISAAEGVRAKGGANVLTAGGKFAGVGVSLAPDAPKWVKDVDVVNGEIVLDVRSIGTIFIIR